MRLGTETGSLVNHLYAAGGQPVPVVGMGATILHWTDRSAGTIVAVTQVGKRLHIEVQGDRAKRVDGNGMSECQSYEYSPNPEGGVSTWRLRADGRWEQVRRNDTGRWIKAGQQGLRIGVRDAYHDFSF